MNNIYFFVLLLYLIKLLKGELSLEIFKEINGDQVPVYNILHEIAGANLTLTCRLLTSSNDIDYELSWGRKRKNVQFDNVMDLQNLAKNSSNPLLQFRTKEGKPNKAVLQFNPIFLFDSGIYFCMSLKYNLFNIIQIFVNVGSDLSDLATYLKALDNSHLDFNITNIYKPLSFPKFMCTNDMFVCNSGAQCYDDKYVCDGIKDCNDGSDENFYLCGRDPCAGKKLCSDGRCISKSLCCDKFRDLDCMVNVQPSCCFEKNKKPKIIKNLPVGPSHNDEFDSSHELNQNHIEVKTIWKHEEHPRIESLWIVVPCIIILILIIVCIMVRQTFMKPVHRTRFIRNPRCALGIPGTNPRGISLVSGRASPNSLNQCSSLSRSVSPNIHPIVDLPPSYDEVMGNQRSVLP